MEGKKVILKKKEIETGSDMYKVINTHTINLDKIVVFFSSTK